MKFQRQPKEQVSVNLTPLIDVVFLLLIFFMVTTTFNRESHLQVTLPEAKGENTEPVPQQIEILITRNGDYSVNGRALVNSRLETLKRALEEISAGDNGIPMVITADAQTSHQSVVTAMDAVGQLGFSRLSIATSQPDQDANGQAE